VIIGSWYSLLKGRSEEAASKVSKKAGDGKLNPSLKERLRIVSVPLKLLETL
jgi:hypothetical protein